MKVYGLTGLNASGKSSVANFFVKNGFIYISLSDMIRDELKMRGMKESRDNFIPVANSLRQEHGPGILGKRAVDRIKELDAKKVVVDSIRNPYEIEELRKLECFTLLGIQASSKIRYERAMVRGRDEGASSLEGFMAQERREMSSLPTAQQLHTCFEMADIIIENNSGIDELHKKLERFL